MAPIEYVESVLMEDWSEDYVVSEHWNEYWNTIGAPSDAGWPEDLTEDGDKLFFNDKLLALDNWVGALNDQWHNTELMHRGR